MRCRGILGNLAAQPFKAAGPRHDLAVEHHGLALGKAEAGAVGQQLPARLKTVQPGAFQFGSKAGRCRTDRRRADEAGVGAPGRKQAIEIIRRHQHIAVGNDDPVVLGRTPALDEIVHLRIGAEDVLADQQARRNARMGLHRTPGDLDRRVVRRGDAEDDLITRPVENKAGADSVFEIVLHPAERPQDRDRRADTRLRLRRVPRLAHKDGEDAEELNGKGDRRSPDQNGHGSSSLRGIPA